MITQEFTITNPTGLHTRPANRFIKEANKFECKIDIKKNDKTADAKSLLKLLKLGISQNDVITMTFDGSDEQAAAEGLGQLIRSLED